MCTSCHSDHLEFVGASGCDVVYSYTVVHRSPDPKLFVMPYVVALIRLARGSIMMSNIVGTDLDTVFCEQPTRLDRSDLDDSNRLPAFHPLEEF